MHVKLTIPVNKKARPVNQPALQFCVFFLVISLSLSPLSTNVKQAKIIYLWVSVESSC